MKGITSLRKSRKEANKLIAKEMDLGENYAKWLLLKAKRKMDLRNLVKVVKSWSM